MADQASFVQIAKYKISSIKNVILDVLFPPKCIICGKIISQDGCLCFTCWGKIDFITFPYCSCCGVPFSYEIEEDLICGKCILKKPKYDKAVAVFVYNKYSNDIIHKFKYNDCSYAAKTLSNWMVREGKKLISDTDLIIPVPLHKLRLMTRFYNQAALLAKFISKNTKIKCDFKSLKRVKNTKQQFGLTLKQRAKNVRNAFFIPEQFKENIKGKNILLVDDVMTTGATINACSYVLKKAGAKKVYVLTLGRTVKEEEIYIE